MGLPKSSLMDTLHEPDLASPSSIFDLVNFLFSEFVGVSGSVVTRLCESEYGITREEWQFVAMLANLGALSPSDLAARTTVDRSQTSKTLRALMLKGLVERQRVPGDGRRALVLLSAEGHALYPQIFPRVVDLHHRVLANVSASEMKLLASTLLKMQASALALARDHKVEGTPGRRQGGSRANWRRQAQGSA
jgi:DNA-binding MarR family transcriptional regulator